MINVLKKYTIIKDHFDLARAIKHIETSDFLAFDTETTGLNVRKDSVIGMSFCGKAGESYYMPLKVWDIEKNRLRTYWKLDDFLRILNMLKNKELLMWNASYDVRIVKNDLGVDLLGSLLADIMLMKHTVAEEGNFGLKATAIEYQYQMGLDVEQEANKEQLELKENVKKNGGSTTKVNYEMFKADLEVMGPYACADADYTFRLATVFREMLENDGLVEFFYDTEVMPLYKKVTIPMESKGVKLDLELIEKYRDMVINDIDTLHTKIIKSIMATSAAKKWLKELSISKYPASNRGTFAQKFVQYHKLSIPVSPTGKFSITQKNVAQLKNTAYRRFLELGVDDLNNMEKVYLKLDDISAVIYEEKHGTINISSKKQMGDLVFKYMKEKPLSKTIKGSPQFNDSMIQKLEDKGHEWAALLGDYNKLNKIKSAYMDRFLDNHEDGYYYFYYKQHGTISGRFSSDAQQLPRTKEKGELSELVLKYNNIIRAFFIAEEDRLFIDADYESLEPHVFSHVSGDEGLRNIFRKGHDFYSTIAIGTEKLIGVSADKKSEIYLGKLNKPLRQKAKAYSLGIPYGLTPYALAKTLGVSLEEAEVLYDGYLDGFLDLKQWMEDSKIQAQTMGYVTTQTGRMRHLDRVKYLYSKHGDRLLDFRYRNSLISKLAKKYGKEEAKLKVQNAYRDYKNGINNSRNFQIQGLSASIVNQAMILIMDDFANLQIDAYVCGTVHDQIIVNASKKHLDKAKEIVNNRMTTVVKLSVELKAPPEVARNWKESH